MLRTRGVLPRVDPDAPRAPLSALAVGKRCATTKDPTYAQGVQQIFGDTPTPGQHNIATTAFVVAHCNKKGRSKLEVMRNSMAMLRTRDVLPRVDPDAPRALSALAIAKRCATAKDPT